MWRNSERTKRFEWSRLETDRENIEHAVRRSCSVRDRDFAASGIHSAFDDSPGGRPVRGCWMKREVHTSMLVTSLIVEDEPLARKTLRDLIAATPWLTLVGEAADGITAIRRIDELKPQLLFLDVDLPELNGLQVLERVSHQPHVVFTTAHDNYAVPAFEFDALDYLLKPFGRERFNQTLERVRRRVFRTQTTGPTM